MLRAVLSYVALLSLLAGTDICIIVGTTTPQFSGLIYLGGLLQGLIVVILWLSNESNH